MNPKDAAIANKAAEIADRYVSDVSLRPQCAAEIFAAIAAAVVAEREECARVADSIAESAASDPEGGIAYFISAAILERTAAP